MGTKNASLKVCSLLGTINVVIMVCTLNNVLHNADICGLYHSPHDQVYMLVCMCFMADSVIIAVELPIAHEPT